MNFRRHLLILVGLIAFAATPTNAATEVAGQSFPDQTRLANTDLVLNGAGLRSKVFFKVYAIGLYLPKKANTASAVLASKGPRSIQILTLRELSGEQLADALVEGVQKNLSPAELAPIAERLDTFKKTMLSIATTPEKTSIRLDYTPDSGTRLSIANTQKGNDIAGEDFYLALLRIWLGDKPVQDDLRAALLGGKQ